MFDKIEVWVDGGIKRGTDVVKALALGARGVGVGRAALFGLGAGGKEGVERVLEILKAETETCMRLLGVERVDQLGLQHVSDLRLGYECEAKELTIYTDRSTPVRWKRTSMTVQRHWNDRASAHEFSRDCNSPKVCRKNDKIYKSLNYRSHVAV